MLDKMRDIHRQAVSAIYWLPGDETLVDGLAAARDDPKLYIEILSYRIESLDSASTQLVKIRDVVKEL